MSPKSRTWLCCWYYAIVPGALWSNMTSFFYQERNFFYATPTAFPFSRTMTYSKPRALQTSTIFSIYFRIVSRASDIFFLNACSYHGLFLFALLLLLPSSIFSFSWCSLSWSSLIIFSHFATSLSLSLNRRFCNSLTSISSKRRSSVVSNRQNPYLLFL